MKKILFAVFCSLPFLLATCASTPPVEGLLSLNEAMAEIVTSMEVKVEPSTEVGVTKVDSSLPELGSFLYGELCNSLGAGGKMVVLAGGDDMKVLDDEHQRQMSGLVSDASAVGIGKYLGAKVMITASFSRFGNFCQFSVKALDVKTGAVLASSRPRIHNNDPLLASVTAPWQNTKAVDVTEDALLHLNKGKEYYAEHKYDGALAEIDKALAINKKLAEAWYYRAKVVFVLGDHRYGYNYDGAIAAYTQAIKIDPNYADAYGDRGRTYNLKGNHDRAIADYTQAIRLDPNNSEYYGGRSFAYRDKGDYYKALADRSMAIQIEPNGDNYYQRDYIKHRYLNNYNGAIVDYTEAIRINPNYSHSYISRGDLYVAQGDYDKAIADYNQLLKIYPDDFRAYVGRGDVYFYQKNYDKVIAEYTEAIKLAPNNGYYLWRGYAYYNKGDYARARADYNKELEIHPNNARARNALNDLGNRGR